MPLPDGFSKCRTPGGVAGIPLNEFDMSRAVDELAMLLAPSVIAAAMLCPKKPLPFVPIPPELLVVPFATRTWLRGPYSTALRKFSG